MILGRRDKHMTKVMWYYLQRKSYIYRVWGFYHQVLHRLWLQVYVKFLFLTCGIRKNRTFKIKDSTINLWKQNILSTLKSHIFKMFKYFIQNSFWSQQLLLYRSHIYNLFFLKLINLCHSPWNKSVKWQNGLMNLTIRLVGLYLK